ncbi:MULTISPECIES: hypothetical protein [unclassified Pseudodesulfovibrio]|uniref:hypothetical protein n=1 Tax=unclassified Pseudodesulfovibrio TaxID=2661612 RepID=UPI000FEB84D7|nr:MULTISPECIES: hypothetical protein [unclassified Pseudodesulfovibrio]MCJ2163136.1 hypothetical protein [Pseudodesulfovibrio sp. S3-i]RWU07128.1 hypothetical protein DWB63_01065 [Pseudodesulfovibrio sp. S3]
MSHEKDACQYSIDICKLFITLASASIAFIVQIIINNEAILPLWIKYPTIILMATSVIAGVFSLMHVTFKVSQGKYDIHTNSYRHCATIQIYAFVLGICFLGGWALSLG